MSAVAVVEDLRKRAARINVSPPAAYTVGDLVWAHFGRTSGLLLGRVVSPHPAAMHSISHLREWWSVEVFSQSARAWNPRPHFRRLLRKLTVDEIAALRGEGVIS